MGIVINIPRSLEQQIEFQLGKQKVLKLMIDSIKGITIIVTGSSSFDLVSHAGELLVGRNIVYHLYPVAQS